MGRPQTISDDQILQTALECLLERGSSVSLETIAGRLDVSPQALLKRFRSKKQLIMAALRPPDVCPWHSLVEAGPTDAPIEDQLLEIVEQLSEFFVNIARRFSVFRFSGLDPRELMQSYEEPPPIADIRVLSAWFDRVAEQGHIRKADHRTTALMLMSSLHTPAMLQDILGSHPVSDDHERNLRGIVDLLLRGLRPEQTEIPVHGTSSVASIPGQ